MFLALFDTSRLLSDEKLMERYKSTGNTWFVGELYKRYSVPVTAICYSYLKNREETEDAVMEIFEIVMKDLLRQDVRDFKPWVATVARHHCLRRKEKSSKESENRSELKKNSSHFMELKEELSLLSVEGESHRDIIEELQKAMDQLRPEQKNCVELFYLKDLSYQEISTSTGIPVNKVKSYIQNGKRNLKIYLESQNAGK